MYINLGTPTRDFITIFDELFNESLETKIPAHDVVENDNEFIVELELAGVKKEDISVDTENGVLTIEAERKKNKDFKYNRKQSYAGAYKKSFGLPDDVDADGIEAKLSDGILTVSIPKSVDETKKKKVITIN